MEVVQTHCGGRASVATSLPPKITGEEISQCATYKCAGELRPYYPNGCSPALPRKVTVQVVIDPEYKKVVGWREMIDTAFNHTNWHFQKWGIMFVISEIREAPLTAGATKLDKVVFDELKKQKAGSKADLHIGFVAKDFRGKHWTTERLGTSSFLQDELVLNAENRDHLSATLVHELGHTFGAIHNYETSSIMSAMAGELDWRQSFDPLSVELIRINKCADFKKGVAGLSDSQLRQAGFLFEAGMRREDLHPFVYDFEELIEEALQRKDEKSAIAFSRRIITLQPHHPIGPTWLGWTYLEFDRYDEARKAFETAESLAMAIPDFTPSVAYPEVNRVSFRSYASSGLGYAWAGLKQPDRARPLFERSIDENKNYSGGWNGLGSLALEANDIPRAIEMFEKALSVNPDSKFAKDGLEKAKKKRATSSPK
jgi:tetratricopeptide (TPR) repeat protein